MLSITYLSSATRLMSLDQLVAMLTRFRARNVERELTGLLLYSGGNIVQTIEGPDDAVLTTYAAIAADRRHRGIIEVFRDQVDGRSFPDWSMGFRNLGDPVDLDGFNDFLHAATADPPHGQDHVRVMLRVFKRTNRG
ncbi:BLUF domain-containing protein [Nocardioides sp.]|uniref:BLUF domain-containing protein n=1 Tax=Nocardioides sp. TaxID=35761 RepID=UPI00271AADD4|nr:BLUF domain-containing protein [Nocardioides sp.]MDO9455385.1 BLUF domain-containing protein [Nocardioides sp.]